MDENRQSRGSDLEVERELWEAGWSGSGVGDGLDGLEPDLFEMFESESAPAHSFSTCSLGQKALLTDAANRARIALVHAERYVADAHGRPNKMSSTVRRLLLQHFHTTDRKAMRDILTRLMGIRRVLEKGVAFACMSQCDPQLGGYANSTQLFGGWGPINVCFDPRFGHFDFARASAQDQEALIIHEAAHRFAGIDDKAYEWQAAFAKLTAKQALDNADSYAYFSVRMNAARPAFQKESEGELGEADLGFDAQQQGPPKRDASRVDLGLTSDQVTSYDWAFAGPAGTKFIALVRSVASEVGLDPGLVAVNLIAEYYRDSYLSPAKLGSFAVGVDDYYVKWTDIAAKVPAHAKVRWDQAAGVTTNVNEAGRTVKSITFSSGPDAALASGVYLKHGEVILRNEARRLGKDFDRLPRETRYMLTRFAFNGGHHAARAELAKALKGRDVLIRKAAKKAGPRRIATLRTAQAVHVGRQYFGAP